MELLNVGGRICVISFQSLEDRIVKDRFSEVSKPKKTNKRIPQLVDEEMPFKTISRKPIVANEAELAENQRSHSAKLRIVERVK
jgi:16S rRNA (cytosine1402-N4)-methyltransferase